MKLTWLILIFYCFSPSLQAQPKQGQKRIDSLLSVLPNANADTNEVNILNELATEYNIVDPEKGIQYANEALTLSKKLNWQFGEMQANQALSVNYINKNDYPKALEVTLTALKIAEQTKDIYNGAKANISLGV